MSDSNRPVRPLTDREKEFLAAFRNPVYECQLMDSFSRKPSTMSDQAERMLKWFEYSHLPERLQETSKPFADLAALICQAIEGGPERTVALRKLLEAKDAAVRAKLNPGG